MLAGAPDTAPALWEVEALSLFLSPRQVFLAVLVYSLPYSLFLPLPLLLPLSSISLSPPPPSHPSLSSFPPGSSLPLRLLPFVVNSGFIFPQRSCLFHPPVHRRRRRCCCLSSDFYIHVSSSPTTLSSTHLCRSSFHLIYLFLTTSHVSFLHSRPLSPSPSSPFFLSIMCISSPPSQLLPRCLISDAVY